jgi:predicted nucleic acid-binding Zn ribbon protein
LAGADKHAHFRSSQQSIKSRLKWNGKIFDLVEMTRRCSAQCEANMNVVEKNRGALIIIAPLVIALIVVWVIYDPFHDTGSSSEGGFAKTPLWVWVLGVGILGSLIGYGISQVRRRTRGEAQLTQEATRDVYRREEADRERQNLP